MPSRAAVDVMHQKKTLPFQALGPLDQSKKGKGIYSWLVKNIHGKIK
jgi:hypothetical protein